MTEETKLILERIDQLDKKFDARMDRLEQKVDKLDQRVGQLEKKVGQLEKKVGQLEKKVDQLEKSFDQLEKRMSDLETLTEELKKDVTYVKIKLEYHVCRSIDAISEAHCEVNKKLDKALQVSLKREMMSLQVNRLESDMRIVKKVLRLA